eukprot:9430038-Pyramimonas_sp.AAC.1
MPSHASDFRVMRLSHGEPLTCATVDASLSHSMNLEMAAFSEMSVLTWMMSFAKNPARFSTHEPLQKRTWSSM